MENEFSGFYKLSPEERLSVIRKIAGLDEKEVEIIRKTGSLDIGTANRMSENVIGTQELPFGIAVNFVINGKKYLIPMSIEEPSVVAAASNAAKMALPEGFTAWGGEPIMEGQIQIIGIKERNVVGKLMAEKDEIIKIANDKDAKLTSLGGGAKSIIAREISTERGRMLIVNIEVDVRDAMGANAVNTMCEAVAPKIESITGGRARLRIITNLARKRIAFARAVWKKNEIGEDAVEGVLDAYAFALADRQRCATHNKGIMNGIDAVAVATAQDFRALEAGAHAYACSEGEYRPLTKYWKDEQCNLVGEIAIPAAVGTVGGASMTSPVAKVALKILGVKSSQEFSQVLAAVGLAQNFAALKALSTAGIQKGHMKLHSKNLAIMAGAQGELIEIVAERMIKENKISATRAKEILEEMKKSS